MDWEASQILAGKTGFGEPAGFAIFRHLAFEPKRVAASISLMPRFEFGFVPSSRLDLDMQSRSSMDKLEIVSMAVADVVGLSGNERQRFQPDFRDPGIRGYCSDAKLVTQEAISMHLANDAREFPKFR